MLSNPKTLKRTQVIPATSRPRCTQILQTVVAYGTGKAAAIPGFAAGKTGTTENYGDAWFVGWNEHMTVAIWVGYPDRLVPMLTEYGGAARSPAAPTRRCCGTTSWTQATAILDQRTAMAEALRNGDDPDSVDVPSTDRRSRAERRRSGADQRTGPTTDSGADHGDAARPTATPAAAARSRRPPTAMTPAADAPPPDGGGDTGAPPPATGGGDANGGGAAAPSG